MAYKRENIGKAAIYLIFFGVLFYIGYQVPYCHDEWRWGLPDRIELMKRGFANYNGRYLGNLLALLITRSIWAKAAVIGVGSVWLLHEVYATACAGLAKEKGSSSVCLLLSAFLLIAVPQTLFCQSYGWSAAFVNFIPPVILFCIYFRWTGEIYNKGAGIGKADEPLWAVQARSHTRSAIAVVLAAATQLFSEHITIFAVLYAAWLIILAWKKTRKLYPLHLSYFLGCMAGAILMFSNSAYRNAASNPQGYKQIGFSLGAALDQFCGEISGHLFLNNRVLNLVLVILLIYRILQSQKKEIGTSVAVLVLTGYSAYSIWHWNCLGWVFVNNAVWNDRIEAVLGLLFYGCVLFCLWRYVSDREKGRLCILYGSTLLVSLPLLAASPIGARCFFVSYALETAAVVRLAGLIIEEKECRLHELTVVLAALTLVAAIVYLRMFYAIGGTDQLRREIIDEAVENGTKEIVLPALPYGSYYWTTEPVDADGEKKFRQFYGIPEDIVLRFE